MEARLPQDKLARLKTALNNWSHKKSATLVELQSLIDFKISDHLSVYCQNKVICKSDSYSAYVVYTKTIIKLKFIVE